MLKRAKIVVVVLMSSATLAQMPNPEAMQAALQKGQADAIRAGDEKLDCNGLETELVSTVQHPAVQSYIAKSGEQAKKDMDTAKGSGGKGHMAAQMAISVVSSIVPGAGMASMIAAQAQAGRQAAQAQQNLQHRMQQMNEMMTIMPQLMRGQRVMELAKGKQCEWMSGDASIPAGTTSNPPNAGRKEDKK